VRLLPHRCVGRMVRCRDNDVDLRRPAVVAAPTRMTIKTRRPFVTSRNPAVISAIGKPQPCPLASMQLLVVLTDGRSHETDILCLVPRSS